MAAIPSSHHRAWTPLRIASVYAVLGGLWILFSDRAVAVLELHPAALTAVQTAKGWLYVLATAGLLYLLVRRATAELAASRYALAASEGRLRHIFENAPVSLWHEDLSEVHRALRELSVRGVTDLRAYFDEHPEFVVDAARRVRVLDVNRATLDLYGARSRDDLLGSLDRVHTPDSYTAFREQLLAFGEGRSIFECEDRNRTIQGRPLTVLVRATIPPGTSALESVVVSIVDLTERKEAERERRELEHRVLHAQKLESLGVLAGGIAHDFNNLLMGILGHADLALTGLPPEAAPREHIERIQTTALRATELSNQMLAYSGRGRFTVEPVDLNGVVAEMVDLLEAAVSKKAAVERRLTPGLPAVEADASQLRRVVLNLIINASDALGDRSGTITVTTGRMRADREYLSRAEVGQELPEGDYLYLEVSDTGSGMAEETRRRIFEPFFTTKSTGRGLGLAAVLGIVRGHGGAVRVWSAPGHGTVFRVLLPCEPAGSTVPRPDASGAAEVPVLGAGAGRTVLLVDDEEAVRSVGEAMLQAGGYRVLTAADGEEGIRVFREHAESIDAVVLDLTMPRVGGDEVLEGLRRLRPDVRVIVSSGYSESDASSRCGGAAGYLQKPYRAAQLLGKLEEVLSAA